MLALQGLQIQVEIARPMVEAIPLERTQFRFEAGLERPLRLGHRQVVQRCITLRHDLAPKVRVEVEIEQRAVHVDEHRVDRIPVDDG